MGRTECAWEARLLDELAAGRWPQAVDPDLQAHVIACRPCAEVAALASALLDERDTARLQASIPPSGLVWWRAGLRARHDAARIAARPIHIAVAVAAVATVVALVAIFGLAPPLEWLSGPEPVPGDPLGAPAGAWLSVTPWILLTLLAACLALGPVAIYLAVKED